VRSARAVDGLQQLRAAGADQPGDANDLSGVNLQGDVGELPMPGQALHLEQRLAARHEVAPLREQVLDGAAGHPADQLPGRGLAGRQVHRRGAPVLQYRHPVADLADLLQPVRDVDHRDALRGQVPDHPEQVGNLVVGQDRTGLVHHDEPRLAGQRPRHADDLLGRRRQAPHHPADRDLRVAEPRQDRARLAPYPPTLDEAARPPRLVTQEHILRDAQVIDQVQLLVHAGDARLHRRLRAGEADLLTEPPHLAGVRPVHPGQHLDERGLAGAVLAQQAVHLTRRDVQIDAVKGADPGEGLHHAGQPQQLHHRSWLP
jgi:hypothetical protein